MCPHTTLYNHRVTYCIDGKPLDVATRQHQSGKHQGQITLHAGGCGDYVCSKGGLQVQTHLQLQWALSSRAACQSGLLGASRRHCFRTKLIRHVCFGKGFSEGKVLHAAELRAGISPHESHRCNRLSPFGSVLQLFIKFQKDTERLRVV